jgi:hypothetical protein
MIRTALFVTGILGAFLAAEVQALAPHDQSVPESVPGRCRAIAELLFAGPATDPRDRESAAAAGDQSAATNGGSELGSIAAGGDAACGPGDRLRRHTPQLLALLPTQGAIVLQGSSREFDISKRRNRKRGCAVFLLSDWRLIVSSLSGWRNSRAVTSYSTGLADFFANARCSFF